MAAEHPWIARTRKKAQEESDRKAQEQRAAKMTGPLASGTVGNINQMTGGGYTPSTSTTQLGPGNRPVQTLTPGGYRPTQATPGFTTTYTPNAGLDKPGATTATGGGGGGSAMNPIGNLAAQRSALYYNVPPEYRRTYDPTLVEEMGPRQVGQEGAILQGPSAAGQVYAGQEAPGALAAQRGALGELAKLYAAGGFSAEERARMEQARRQQEQTLRGAQLAAQRARELRGVGTSGQEISEMQQAAQGSAETRALQDVETAAMEAQRRERLLGQGAALAGQMRGMAVTEAQARAQAQDRVSELNTLAEQARQMRNVGREDEARAIEQEMEFKRRIYNAQAETAADIHKAGLPREVWQDRMQGMAFWQDPAMQEYLTKLQTDEAIRQQEAAEPEPWEQALGLVSNLVPSITYDIGGD